MTHTPGPWRTDANYDKRGIFADIPEDRMLPAHVGLIARVESHWEGNGVINANVRLIAAAPALLEALVDIRFKAQNWRESREFAPAEVLDLIAGKARAAIALARGEALSETQAIEARLDTLKR